MTQGSGDKLGVLLPPMVYTEVLRLTAGIQQSIAKYDAIDTLHGFARFVLKCAPSATEATRLATAKGILRMLVEAASADKLEDCSRTSNVADMAADFLRGAHCTGNFPAGNKVSATEGSDTVPTTGERRWINDAAELLRQWLHAAPLQAEGALHKLKDETDSMLSGVPSAERSHGSATGPSIAEKLRAAGIRPKPRATEEEELARSHVATINAAPQAPSNGGHTTGDSGVPRPAAAAPVSNVEATDDAYARAAYVAEATAAGAVPNPNYPKATPPNARAPLDLGDLARKVFGPEVGNSATAAAHAAEAERYQATLPSERATEPFAPHRDDTPMTWARMRPASSFKGDVRVVEAYFAAELEISLNPRAMPSTAATNNAAAGKPRLVDIGTQEGAEKRIEELERELADANSAAAHYVRDEPDITPRRALVRQAVEIERLKGELHAMTLRCAAADRTANAAVSSTAAPIRCVACNGEDVRHSLSLRPGVDAFLYFCGRCYSCAQHAFDPEMVESRVRLLAELDAAKAAQSAAGPSSTQEPVAWMIRHKGCVVGCVETMEETALHRARDEGAEEVMPLYAAPVSAIAPKLLEVGTMVEIPDGFDAQPNTIFCEWNELRSRLPAGTKVCVVAPPDLEVAMVKATDGRGRVHPRLPGNSDGSEF